MNVVEITVPPLRERAEDIPCLTAAFVRRFARVFNRPETGGNKSLAARRPDISRRALYRLIDKYTVTATPE